MNRFKYGYCIFGLVNLNLHESLLIGEDRENVAIDSYVGKLCELVKSNDVDVYYGDDTTYRTNSSPLGVFKFTFHGEPYSQN